MKWIITLVLLGFVAGPSALACQEQNLELQMARYVYSPGIIMKHQARLDLTEEQEEAIRARTRTFQDEVDEVQWDLEGRTQEWLELLSLEEADPDSLLSVFGGIVDLESEIKRYHMALLLDIRGLLSLDQRKTLQEIMNETLRGREGRGT